MAVCLLYNQFSGKILNVTYNLVLFVVNQCGVELKSSTFPSDGGAMLIFMSSFLSLLYVESFVFSTFCFTSSFG